MMASGRLRVTACIGEGWRAFWRDPWLGLAPFLLYIVIAAVSFVPLAGGLVVLLLTGAMYGGLCLLGMHIIENRSPQLSDLSSGFPRFARFLGAYLFLTLVTLVCIGPMLGPMLVAAALMESNRGLPFLIMGCVLAPFSIVAISVITIRWLFVFYVLADQPEIPVMAAFRHSWEMTRGNFWRLLGLNILAACVMLLSLMCLLVGVLVGAPVAWLAFSAAYVQLRGAPAALAPVAMESAEAPPIGSPTI